MRNTKTITLSINWVDQVTSGTVADAIAYLQTLDPSHSLSCYLEGDTHGCEIVASVDYEVPLTNAEMLSMLEKHYTAKAQLYELAKEEHLKNGRTERANSCDRLLEPIYSKLAEARAKYS